MATKTHWDPSQYQKFHAARFRPGLDLIEQINIENPKTIVDLGCGPGDLTELLLEKFPNASVTGFDSSPDMLEKAKKQCDKIHWQEQDLHQWNSDDKYDLIFSNAALQWINNHDEFFPSMCTHLNTGGMLAVQMPNNFSEPSHLAIKELIHRDKWKDKLAPIARKNPVASLDHYYQMLSPFFDNLNLWETTYHQVLTGDNPAAEWVKGTGLRPFLSALPENEANDFFDEYSELVKQKYPKQVDGKTLFPFQRIFMVGDGKV